MKAVRLIAWVVLSVVFLAAIAADFIAPAAYEVQFRESPNAPPDARFPLGTDELGRDRLSRLLHGSRVSFLLAPAAAAVAVLIASLVGGIGGYLGGWWDKLSMRGTDLVLSLPWMFLLLAARSALPLNAPPLASMAITSALLGAVGWAASARVVRAAVIQIKDSDYIRQARSAGCGTGRLIAVQVIPNVRTILLAQFWVSIPTFILSEANLGLLGLGVAEPLPSLGNMLREMTSLSKVAGSPWVTAPAVLLVAVVSCFQIVLRVEERRA
jgi:peptide/nickel transport system permease protein